MATEAIHSFMINGREFVVLWKPSAAYLRADGHMWGGSLGEGLDPEDAIARALVRAETMIVEERAQEVLAIHRLYRPATPDIDAVPRDYVKLTLEYGGKPFPVLTAPFNRNAYVCLHDGWHFADIAENTRDALAVAQAYLERLPPERRQPGVPDLPPADEPATVPAKTPFSPFKAVDTVMKIAALGTALWVAYVFYAEATKPTAPMAESVR